MEENKKMNSEEVETKENTVPENDCELSDEELEEAAGGITKTRRYYPTILL